MASNKDFYYVVGNEIDGFRVAHKREDNTVVVLDVEFVYEYEAKTLASELNGYVNEQ